MRYAILVVSLMAGLAPSATAQQLTPTFKSEVPHFIAQARDTALDHTSAMITGGILGGAGGLFVGAGAGMGVEQALTSRCYEYCGLAGLIIGSMVGEAAGVALGSHVAGGGHGNYGAEFAASAGILVTGALIASAAGRGQCDCGNYIFFFGVPIAQIAAVVAIEHATAKRDP